MHLEDLWRITMPPFSIRRASKVKAMKAEMPVRHWATLPEAQIIPDSAGKGRVRVIKMAKTQKTSAAQYIPATHMTWPQLAAARACRGCELVCASDAGCVRGGAVQMPRW